MGRSVGVRDVAALAGVSPQTVSRVLNEHPSVRDETRRRVRDAMLTLGYRVNNAARTLGTSRTRTLGVIASNAALFGPSMGVVALEAAARAAGRWVTTAYADAEDEASIEASLEHLLAQGVDGVVMVVPRVRSVARLARMHPDASILALPSDGGARQETAAALVVEHLVGLGHRRIARVGGPADWLEEAARARGFEHALSAAGLAPAAHWRGDWSAASGARLAAEVAAGVRSGRLTAVALANDQMALGLVSALAAESIRVPGDVSVVGFDDNTDSAYYLPALTTVRVDVDGEARRTVARALGLQTTDAVVDPVVVVRDSTARASRGPARRIR